MVRLMMRGIMVDDVAAAGASVETSRSWLIGCHVVREICGDVAAEGNVDRAPVGLGAEQVVVEAGDVADADR